MKLVLKILSVLVGIILLVLILGFIQTARVLKSENQRQFSNGKLPSPTLDGFLRGSTDFYKSSWQGKTFSTASSTGINNFGTGETAVQKYPFKTSVGKGLQDTNINVVKIDYQSTENPFWIRPILDEVVEVAPGQYLGKIHFRLIPGHPFTLGYFRLETKENAKDIRDITIRTKDFSVALPQNWKVEFDDKTGNPYGGLNAQSPDFQFTLTTSTEENKKFIYHDFGARLDIRATLGKATSSPVMNIIEEKNIQIDGRPAKYYVYQEDLTKAGTLLAAFVTTETKTYLLRFVYNEKTYYEGKNHFQKILNSLQLR